MLAVLAAALAIGGIYAVRRRASERSAADTPAAPAPGGESAAAEPARVERTDVEEAIESARSECLKLAFGVQRFDYQILGEHALVLQRIGAALDTAVWEPDYFPRRPMLLPKLMRALNDDASTRGQLVQLILEDPALAGNVLQRANSAYYRLSPEPVESLDRAVVMLGYQGLRSILATAILQPVFRLPKGYFGNFATAMWDLAQRTAAACEVHAKHLPGCDPFVAQLLGVLNPLARIVLFRLAMDKYRELPHLLPRAEVFIRAMQEHASHVAVLVASTWELTDMSLAALRSQASGVLDPQAPELGRVIFVGELCGCMGLLHRNARLSADAANATLAALGIDRPLANALWRAASTASE